MFCQKRLAAVVAALLVLSGYLASDPGPASPPTQAQVREAGHFADPAVTPYVLRADLYAAGTAKKVNGKWVFWNIVVGPVPL